jgi:spore coat polysaccharide biosynthesis protein SpsF
VIGKSRKRIALVVVAVRLNSTRLPRKALADLHGQPLIIRLTERVKQARLQSGVVWCSSTHRQDDPLEELAAQNNVAVFRGSELDVMSRFIEVAIKNDATTVVRVTGDNPLTDPIMMDDMLDCHWTKNSEYTFNEELPVGTRSEVIDVDMMMRCHQLLRNPSASEYMSWMFNRPDQFRTLDVKTRIAGTNYPELCLTVDFQDQLEVMQKIYQYFDGTPPSLDKIIKWIKENGLLEQLTKSRPNPYRKAEMQPHSGNIDVSFKTDKLE